MFASRTRGMDFNPRSDRGFFQVYSMAPSVNYPQSLQKSGNMSKIRGRSSVVFSRFLHYIEESSSYSERCTPSHQYDNLLDWLSIILIPLLLNIWRASTTLIVFNWTQDRTTLNLDTFMVQMMVSVGVCKRQASDACTQGKVNFQDATVFLKNKWKGRWHYFNCLDGQMNPPRCGWSWRLYC